MLINAIANSLLYSNNCSTVQHIVLSQQVRKPCATCPHPVVCVSSISYIKEVCVQSHNRLTDLHGKRESVNDDEDEDAVLEAARRHEPPDLVLEADAWNVATLRLHFQRELDAFPLYDPQPITIAAPADCMPSWVLTRSSICGHLGYSL